MKLVVSYLLIIFLLGSSVAQEEEGKWRLQKNITLIVVGRSGMGISSTVLQMIGNQKEVIEPTGSPTPIKEFQVPIPGQQGLFFKIIDVNGLVDGKSIQDDAEVISALNCHLTDPDGLNSTVPDFFLLISNFDDSRFQGDTSLFVQTLDRVATVQKSLYNSTTTNNLLLLTRFMSATKSTQRRPQTKINGFRETLRDFSAFNDSMDILVGENLDEDEELEVQNGFIKLPNGDLYPKNVYDGLIAIANRTGNSAAVFAMENLRDSLDKSGQIRSEFYTCRDAQDESKAAEVAAELYQATSGTVVNEVNSAIDQARRRLNGTNEAQGLAAMTRLQLHLQSQNITKLSQLPQRTLERVEFFQNLPEISSLSLGLLNSAFNLLMPTLLQNPVVGYGYDVLQDARLLTSPFLANSTRASRIGYLIPPFLTCAKTSEMETKEFAYFTPTLKDYIPLRYKFLGYELGHDFSQMPFLGVVKPGFNLMPEESEVMVSLSAVREVRTIKCELDAVPQFTEEFKDAVNELSPFVASDKNSVRAWNGFFNEYGTHVVSEAYAGGTMEGSAIGSSLWNAIRSTDNQINVTLSKVLNFQNYSQTETPTYRFYGGDKDQRLEYASTLAIPIKEELLRTWETSLNYDPVMLEYDLKLTPIAFYAKLVNGNIGDEVERTAELLIKGNLKYQSKFQKPKNRNTTRPTTTTVTPLTTTTTTTTPTPVISTTVSALSFGTKTENPYRQSSNVNKPEITTTKINPNVQPAKGPSPKTNHTDYISSTLGQGYHMLEERILPNGPFTHRSIIQATRWVVLKPCTMMRNNQFNSLATYVEDRLLTKFGVSTVPPDVFNNFYGAIMPGNMIRGISKTYKTSVEVLSDYQRIEGSEILKLNNDFLRDIRALPPFLYFDLPDCSGRIKWRNFFTKYGTHYVKSTMMGRSNKIQVPLREIRWPEGQEGFLKTAPICQLCEPGKDYYVLCSKGWFSTEIQGFSAPFKYGYVETCTEHVKDICRFPTDKFGYVKAVDRVKASFEFGHYRDLPGLDREIALSVDEAMYHLMENNLAC